MLKKITTSLVMALSFGGMQGCASTGSHMVGLAASVGALDAVAGVGVAYAAYTFAQTPSWSAKLVSSELGQVHIELERSMFAEGGDGAASMVFRMAAKKWCVESGSKGFLTLEFVEFYEPRMLGAARRASGEARCV